MTTWQYGLGQVAAFAIDSGPRWSRDWLDWPGYSAFWTQTARWALRRRAGNATAVEIETSGGEATLRVARRSAEGLTLDELGPRVRLSRQGTDAPARYLTLSTSEPGIWQVTVPVDAGGRYEADVVTPLGESLAKKKFVAPKSDELRWRSPDVELLARIAAWTGSDAEAATMVRRARIGEVTPVWWWFVLAVMLLLPADAFLRKPGRDG